MITSNRSLWSFLVLTCLLSWPIWIASGVLPRGGAGLYDFRWLIAQVGVFGPSLAALMVSGAGGKELRWNSLRMLPVLLLPLIIPGLLTAASASSKVSEFPWLPSVATVVVAAGVMLFFSPLNRRLLIPGTGEVQRRPRVAWVLLSIAFFPGLFVLAWGLDDPRGETWGNWAFLGNMQGFASIVLVSFAHNFLLGGSLGEEIGWRGFLLPQLLKRNGPLGASLLLGLFWALWHAPIDLYAGFVLQGPGAIAIRIIWTLPVTILFTWFYLRARGSLLVPLFLHTSLNVLPDLGFPNYERTMILFFILIAVVASVVSVASRSFRIRASAQNR